MWKTLLAKARPEASAPEKDSRSETAALELKAQSDAALRDKMKSSWWYYTVELADGDIVQGVYSERLPFAPRIMQRRVNVAGMDCLDVGSAEGLLPILCKKNGARRVVATDNLAYEFYDRLQFLQSEHGVEIEFSPMERAIDIASLDGQYREGFDYINLSGILYHVLSPIDAIAASRSLLRPNGLMLLSTITTFKPGCFMEFNHRGRLQNHYNVFWYVSCEFFEYAMRVCSLEPIDVEFVPSDENGHGYLSVLARATDTPATVKEDDFPILTRQASHEFDLLRNRPLPRSEITTRGLSSDLVYHADTQQVDLWATVNSKAGLGYCERTQESRVFMLSDME